MAISKKELEERKQLLQDLVELNEKEAKSLKQVEAAETRLNIARRTNSDSTAQLEQNVKNLRKQMTPLAKDMEKQKEEIKKAEEALELYEKRVKAAGDAAKGAAGAFDGLFGTNMSNYIDTTQKLGLNLEAVIKGQMAYMKVLNESRVSLGRQTGMFTAFNKVFDETQKQTAGFSGTIEEITAAIGGLSTGFSRFNALSEKQQSSLATLGVRFQKLGVSAEQFAQTQEALSYAFGLTDEALAGATSNLDKFAMSIGTVPNKVLEDLTSLAPELARFGSDGQRVFKNLARQARQLGLTTQQAFDLTELFDTFEGAANAAGRLNAQLGLQVNSVELMTANSDERLELLRQEFALQGKSFELMGKREKQMVADILGTDVMTAGKALGGKIPLSQLAKETEREDDKIVTLTEAGQSLAENFYAKNNENFRGLNSTMINAVQGIGENTSLLGLINTAVLGLTAILAVSQGVSTIKNLRSMRASGPKGPSSGGKVDTKTPGSKVDTPSNKKGGNSKQRRKERRRIKAEAKKAAGKAKTKVPTSVGKKGLGKAAGKSLLKKIPLLGIGAGLLFAGQRALAGDFTGAGLELASGVASSLPGPGTAASVGIDAALAARDMGAFDSKASTPKAPEGMASISRSARATRAAEAKKPVVVQGITVPVTVKAGNRELGKAIATIDNQLLNPVTPATAMG